MTNQQMELGFGGGKLVLQPSRRERRVKRGAWWFAHMRRIVDRALDWEAAAEARPEQTWLPGTQRQVSI
jgi:hypothetical protein